jgi:hypothetical protein
VRHDEGISMNGVLGRNAGESADVVEGSRRSELGTRPRHFFTLNPRSGNDLTSTTYEIKSTHLQDCDLLQLYCAPESRHGHVPVAERRKKVTLRQKVPVERPKSSNTRPSHLFVSINIWQILSPHNSMDVSRPKDAVMAVFRSHMAG